MALKSECDLTRQDVQVDRLCAGIQAARRASVAGTRRTPGKAKGFRHLSTTAGPNSTHAAGPRTSTHSGAQSHTATHVGVLCAA